eukprot:7936953-Pyramimonas_sp.AAC.1
MPPRCCHAAGSGAAACSGNGRPCNSRVGALPDADVCGPRGRCLSGDTADRGPPPTEATQTTSHAQKERTPGPAPSATAWR